jgi:glycerol-3-phosphate acyltransferase PlsX
MRIALDAMGGDHAPQATVEGAYLYQKATRSQNELILVGQQDAVTAELNKHRDWKDYNIRVVHASEAIGMHESPTDAIKQKKDSSMVVGLNLHKAGEVEAFVSAGNTGAQMAASLLSLGRIPGVNRPAIGAFLPSEKGMVFILDIGANVDSKPINLFQNGVMGSIFVDHVFPVKDMKIGLLNIGAEEKKGNEATQAAYGLMKEGLRGFHGNVEGRDILKSDVHVLVCDGFVGNIVIKFAESVMGVVAKSFKRNLGSNLFTNIGALLVKPAFSEMRRSLDYEEYGGVPLLGVNGISIICHGSSNGKAIKNALRVAEQMSEKKVNQHIAETFKNRGGQSE